MSQKYGNIGGFVVFSVAVPDNRELGVHSDPEPIAPCLRRQTGRRAINTEFPIQFGNPRKIFRGSFAKRDRVHR
jgi:hypothetical protein